MNHSQKSAPERTGYKAVYLDLNTGTRYTDPTSRNQTVWKEGVTCEQGRTEEPTAICSNGLHWSTVPAATLPFIAAYEVREDDATPNYILCMHHVSVPPGIPVFAHDFGCNEVSDKDPNLHKRVSSKLTLGPPLTGIFVAPGHYKLLSLHDGRLDSKHSLADLRGQWPDLFGQVGDDGDDDGQWIVPSLVKTVGRWSYHYWYIEGLPLVQMAVLKYGTGLLSSEQVILQRVTQWPDRIRTVGFRTMTLLLMHRDLLVRGDTLLRRWTFSNAFRENIKFEHFYDLLERSGQHLLPNGAMTEPFLRSLFDTMTVPCGSLCAELSFDLLCKLAQNNATRRLVDMEVLMMLYPEILRHDPSGNLFRKFLNQCRHRGGIPAYRTLERLSDDDLVTVLETTDRKGVTIVSRIMKSRSGQRATGKLPFLERYLNKKKSEQ